ncbi:polysaccharide lyase family 8 super-sandwich domain-containing protein [Lentisphaerota bacterium WC36G]|nr:polysaccharide lyase beta-sandwich domain-containing protein [Lentisphaerae bacterium WC36]
MFIKKLILRTLFIVMSIYINSSAIAKSAADFIIDKVKNNNQLYKAKDGHIAKVLKLYKNGRFTGVDYTKQNKRKSDFPQKKHMEYLAAIASGYLNKNSKYYHDKKLRDIIFNGLLEWCKLDPRDKNWWWRNIGGPKRFLPMIAAMSNEIVRNPKVRKAVGEYYINNWSGKLNPDSNSTQEAQMALVGYAILGSDKDILRIAKLASHSLIKVQTRLGSNKLPQEGIQLDYGFNLHGGSGAQNYWGNYGAVYLSNINWWVSIFNKTKYAFPKEKTAVISNCYLKGVQWVCYNNHMDLMVRGRFSESKSNASGRFLGSLKSFIATNPPYKEKLKKFSERLTTKKQTDSNNLTGSRVFWLHDQLVHRNEKYYISLNYNSKRSVANEFGNNAGANNYYTASGVTTILVDGDEMPLGLIKKWNWRLLPGVTALQDSGKLPIVFWGQKGTNNTDFAGSVTDKKMLVTGFQYSRKGVKANKAWFFFDKGFVALANGISSKEKFEVKTTINQVLDNKKENANFSDNKIFYNKVGYFSPQKMVYSNSNSNSNSNNILWIGFNHGKNPDKSKYEYLVTPAISLEEFAKTDVKKLYTVLANNSTVQAVKFPKGIVQAVFYRRGILKINNYFTISANQGTILMFKMLNKKQAALYYTTPFGYNERKNFLEVFIKFKNINKKLSLPLHGGLAKGYTRAMKINLL